MNALTVLSALASRTAKPKAHNNGRKRQRPWFAAFWKIRLKDAEAEAWEKLLTLHSGISRSVLIKEENNEKAICNRNSSPGCSGRESRQCCFNDCCYWFLPVLQVGNLKGDYRSAVPLFVSYRHTSDYCRCISFPQQQRGLLSPPLPGFAPRVTRISQPHSGSGQR